MAGGHTHRGGVTEPVAIAVSVAASGGATAFVADHGSNTVTPIDVATMTAGAPIAVGPGPQTIAAAPGEVLVGNFGNRTLTADQPDVAAGRAAPLRSRSTRPASPWRRRAPPPTCAEGRRVRGGRPSLGLAVGAPIALPGVAQGIALSADGSTAWVTQQAGALVPRDAGRRDGAAPRCTSAATPPPSSSGRLTRRSARVAISQTLYTARARKRRAGSVSSSM